MKRGKYEAPYVPKRHSSKKALAMLLSLVLVIGCVVGGTLAWLTAESGEVKNDFTTSDIGVALEESENLNLKMVPGWTITKDPKAWITDGSEAAYLFVEVKESENFDDFMTYAIADGWTLLDTTTVGNNIDTVPNDTYVIYRKVTAADQMGKTNAFAILEDDQVTVLEEVTKEDMKALTDATMPSLSFTAYAVQLYRENSTQFTAAEAWDMVDDN